MEKKVCPDCKGKKVIVGNCECNSEWRHQNEEGHVDDCICDPDQECATCNGTGYVTA